MKFTVGFDFDNTLVCYDHLMHEEALKRGWISIDCVANKRLIRDTIRRLTDGETKWQILQTSVYGPEMHRAAWMPGAREFLLSCRDMGAALYVVSHKTEYAAMDKVKKYPLRDAALKWMEEQGFFNDDLLGFQKDDIFFESTRKAKVRRVGALGCSLFIDDLIETFEEPEFPASVAKYLYSPVKPDTAADDIKVVSEWREMYDYVPISA